MHAIVCQGNGRYYVSAVFGYYKDITAEDKYQRYLEEIHKPYCIVWNPEKSRLIPWSVMVQNTDCLIQQIIVVDSDLSNWNINEDGEGCVDFLSRELLDSFLDNDTQPDDILARCRALDDGYEYKEIREISTQKDAEDLEWASGYFHDACIAEEELRRDGTLYLRFEDTWGCGIEVWLWGDLEYDTSYRNPEYYDPYWSGCTVLLQDGFVYFVDDLDMTVDKISPGYCWFKARHMKYRIIPA